MEGAPLHVRGGEDLGEKSPSPPSQQMKTFQLLGMEGKISYQVKKKIGITEPKKKEAQLIGMR